MARKITIPIADHEEEGVCSNGYIVEYKLNADIAWATLYPQQYESPIVLTNLANDSLYDIRIKRVCCNGETSAWSTLSVDTTIEE